MMNHLYSHPHSHIGSVSQQLNSSGTIGNSLNHSNVSKIVSNVHQQEFQNHQIQNHFHHHLQQQIQQNNPIQDLHLPQQSQPLLQPQVQSQAAVAAAAASIYARNETLNAKRHIQNASSNLPSLSATTVSTFYLSHYEELSLKHLNFEKILFIY
jgi:hypothetical protein